MRKKNKEQIAEKYNFKFRLEIEKINDNECKFTLLGRHYSANDVNRWLSFQKRNAYKNSIRQAFLDYFEENEKKFQIFFDKVIMYSISYNKNSRDDDGNRITLKPFRDMLKEKGFIKDDSRKHLFELPNFEVTSSEYRTEVYLKRADKIPSKEEFLKCLSFLN